MAESILIQQLDQLASLYPEGIEDESVLTCILDAIAAEDCARLAESLTTLTASKFILCCLRILCDRSPATRESGAVARHVYQCLFVHPRASYRAEVAHFSTMFNRQSPATESDAWRKPPLETSLAPLSSAIAEEEWASGETDEAETQQLVLENTLTFYREIEPQSLLAPILQVLRSSSASAKRKYICLDAIRGALFSADQLPWDNIGDLEDDEVLGRLLCNVSDLRDRAELWPIVERLIHHQDGKRAIFILMNIVDVNSPGWRAFFALFTETKHHRSIHLLKPIWNSMMRDMIKHSIPHPFVRVLYTKALDDKEQLKEVGKVAILQALFVSEWKYHDFIDEHCFELILSAALHTGLSSLIMRQLFPSWLRGFPKKEMLCVVAARQLCKMADFNVNLQLLKMIVDIAPASFWNSSKLVERTLYYSFRQSISNQQSYIELLFKSLLVSSKFDSLSGIACCTAIEKYLPPSLYRDLKKLITPWIQQLPHDGIHFLLEVLPDDATYKQLRQQRKWTGVLPSNDLTEVITDGLENGSDDVDLAALCPEFSQDLLKDSLSALTSESPERQFFAVAVCASQKSLSSEFREPLLSFKSDISSWTLLWNALAKLADKEIVELALEQVDNVSATEIGPLIRVAEKSYSAELLEGIYEVLINARRADGGKLFSEMCTLWSCVALNPIGAVDVNPKFVECLVALESKAGGSLAGLSLHIAEQVGFPRWMENQSVSLCTHFIMHGVPIVERQTIAETVDPKSDYALRFTLPRLVALLYLTTKPAFASEIVLKLFSTFPPATQAYFDSSPKALESFRMWQALCLLAPLLDHETMVTALPSLIAAIESHEGKYQRKLMSAFAIHTLSKYPDLAPPIFSHFFGGSDVRHAPLRSCFDIFIGLLEANVLSDSITEHLVLQIVPFCQSVQGKIRGHAQTLVYKISQMNLNLGGEVRFLLDTMSGFLTKNYKVSRFQNNVTAGKLPECDWETIFCTFPVESMVSEWMPPVLVNQMASRLGLDFQVSSDGPQPNLTEGEATGLFFDPAGTELGAYQRKPTQLMEIDLEVAEAHRVRAPLIVCASLIDRAPNLGGLTRTCEIFNAELLTMSKKSMFMKTRDYLNTAVSSDRHQPIVEVNEKDLVDYLLKKRSQGYALVGMEQSESSESLLTFQFPEKCVLVLGAEKTGMPQHLIDMLDFLVEIPQYGIIRSLNVHVSASLLIWTYTQQHTSKRG